MQARYIRRSGLPQADLGAESLALLDSEQGMYFGLDGTALRIWQLLETPKNLTELCAQIVEEFDVAPDLCRQHVEEFLAQLLEQRLVLEAS